MIIGSLATRILMIDGDVLRVAPSVRLRMHSPDGFNRSTSAALARAKGAGAWSHDCGDHLEMTTSIDVKRAYVRRSHGR